MSSTTEPITFLDLQNDIISRIRTGSGALDYELAKRLLNVSLVNMHSSPGSKFPWLERGASVITHATYNTGTVSVTTSSSRTAVTGSGTLWNTAVTGFGFNNARAGGKIKLASSTEVLGVASVTSDTALTLDTLYTGDDLSGVGYTYFEDEYALAADFGGLVDARNFSTSLNIPIVGRTDFRRLYVRNDFFQRPKVATLIQLEFSGNTSPRDRVVFHPAPNDEYTIPYSYYTTNYAVSASGIPQASLELDNDEPVVPRRKRQAITIYAKYQYWQDYGDDARSQSAYGEYTDYMTRICGDVNLGDSRPQFVNARRRGGYLNQRYDYGNRFDELRDRR